VFWGRVPISLARTMSMRRLIYCRVREDIPLFLECFREEHIVLRTFACDYLDVLDCSCRDLPGLKVS